MPDGIAFYAFLLAAGPSSVSVLTSTTNSPRGGGGGGGGGGMPEGDWDGISYTKSWWLIPTVYQRFTSPANVWYTLSSVVWF